MCVASLPACIFVSFTYLDFFGVMTLGGTDLGLLAASRLSLGVPGLGFPPIIGVSFPLLESDSR